MTSAGLGRSGFTRDYAEAEHPSLTCWPGISVLELFKIGCIFPSLLSLSFFPLLSLHTAGKVNLPVSKPPKPSPSAEHTSSCHSAVIYKQAWEEVKFINPVHYKHAA